jgi:hypothetical protein
MRMHAQTAMIENGFVHLPKEAGWRAEYLHELTIFPGGKHDDQVDSTAPAARLAQAGRPRAQRHLPVLQGARPRGARPAARAIIVDSEAVGHPPVVTMGPQHEGTAATG